MYRIQVVGIAAVLRRNGFAEVLLAGSGGPVAPGSPRAEPRG